MKVPSPSILYTNLLVLRRSGGWALQQAWATNRKLVIAILSSFFVQSATPVMLALSARGTVNAVVENINSDVRSYAPLLIWLALGLLFTLLEALSRFAVNFLKERLQDDLNLKITSDILVHADTLDLSCFEDPGFQDIMSRARQGTGENIAYFVIDTLSAIKSLIQSASLIGLLVVIDPLIAVLMLPISLPYLMYQWRYSEIVYRIERARATKRRWTEYFTSRLTSHEAVPEVKLLGLGGMLIQEFKRLMQAIRDENRRLFLRRLAINVVFATLSTTAAYVIFTRVAFKAIEGAISVGDVAIFGGAAIRLRISIESAIWETARAIERALYVSNLQEFFSVEPQMVAGGGRDLGAGRVEIELKDVHFRYPGSVAPVLKGVSLRIRAGETVALVGENGAGKSTLAKLMARLYDPSEGVVYFDGHDVREFSIEELQRKIAFVFQNFGRYEATVCDNIAYGDWGRLQGNHDQVGRIAEIAGVRRLIEKMPKGYDTMLGRTFGEYTLSGGQWQQIALARAFARDAAFMILDEPTSNLDAKAEYELFSRYREIAEGRTTVLISHRFSTVSIADRIFVIDSGRIVEQGTHNELLQTGGHYATLYELHRRQMTSS